MTFHSINTITDVMKPPSSSGKVTMTTGKVETKEYMNDFNLITIYSLFLWGSDQD